MLGCMVDFLNGRSYGTTANLLVEFPDARCCGVANAFRFAEEALAVLQVIGERRCCRLAVHAASGETIVVAD
jgi:hypothetical protein